MNNLNLLSNMYTAIIAGLAVILLFLFIYRNYRILTKKSERIPFLKTQQIYPKILKVLFGIGLLLMLINIPVYGLIGSAFRAIVPDLLNTFLIVVSLLIALSELLRCFTISNSTLTKTAKKTWFTIAVILIFPFSVYFAYYIPGIFCFPPKEKCITLNVPVNGKWLAAHGGESEVMNHHNQITSQKYAVDMVKINPDRTFYNNKGEELTDFPTYGAKLKAPCSGKVVTLVDSLPDVEVSLFGQDSVNPAGNYLAVQHSDTVFVIMAHIKPGSFNVSLGDSVQAGDLLARAGNSGNTTWPHLHLHVQNRPEIDFDARGIPFRFRTLKRKRWLWEKNVENGYLLRNDLFYDSAQKL